MYELGGKMPHYALQHRFSFTFGSIALQSHPGKPNFKGEPLEKKHQSRFSKHAFGDQASKPIFNG